MKVHDVKNTPFWDDIWAAEVPLRLKFPRVYGCCRDKNAIVRDCWVSSSWDFDFCRTFGPDELKEWEELLSLLQDFNFSDSPDRAVWVLEKTGVFSTRSLYRSLSFRGVINKRLQLVWESKLPMKIKVFLWLGFQNRLPSGAAQPLSVENGREMIGVTCAGWWKRLTTFSFIAAWRVLFGFALRRHWAGIGSRWG